MPTSKSSRGAINIGTPIQSARTLPGISAVSGDTAQLRRLSIDLIEPDPGQARHILPPGVRERVVHHELDAPGALAAWVALARQDPLEARRLDEIASLAHSLKREGQVKPVTVVRSPTQGRYRIETGERRFWAHQYAVHQLGHKDQEMIDAIVRHEARRARQAVENLFAEPLTAIAFGRMVAQLLHEKDALQITDPGRFIGRDLTATDYRELAQARVKRGGWDAIVATTGKQEDLLANHLRLLTLPEEVQVVADRGGLSERALRAVTRLADPALQLRVVRLAAELDLTAGQVQALTESDDLDALETELRTARTPAVEASQAPGSQPAPAKKKVAARAQHAPSRVLWTRIQALREFRHRMLKGKQNPTKILAGEIAKQGKDAEQDIRETITFLEAVLRELKGRR